MTYKSKFQDQFIDRLFQGILTLKDEGDCYRFFEDICTVGEIKSLAQRLAVAEMLEQDETYTAIAEKTGASTATISRVKKCLNYGADGYNLVLANLNKLDEKKE